MDRVNELNFCRDCYTIRQYLFLCVQVSQLSIIYIILCQVKNRPIKLFKSKLWIQIFTPQSINRNFLPPIYKLLVFHAVQFLVSKKSLGFSRYFRWLPDSLSSHNMIYQHIQLVSLLYHWCHLQTASNIIIPYLIHSCYSIYSS